MTWNVGECKPEGPQFFRWLVEKAQSAAVVVITLQEIEMGGSSIVMGGVKDSLFKAAQVGPCMLLPGRVPCPGLAHRPDRLWEAWHGSCCWDSWRSGPGGCGCRMH